MNWLSIIKSYYSCYKESFVNLSKIFISTLQISVEENTQNVLANLFNEYNIEGNKISILRISIKVY